MKRHYRVMEVPAAPGQPAMYYVAQRFLSKWNRVTSYYDSVERCKAHHAANLQQERVVEEFTIP